MDLKDRGTRQIRRISRACQNCQMRKVKCNGDPERCQQCTQLNLSCAYMPSKSYVQGHRMQSARGSVILRLRHAEQLSPVVKKNRHATKREDTLSELGSPESLGPSTPRSPVLGRFWHTSEFTKAFFRSLVPQYQTYVYCLTPIVTPSEMLEAIDRMDQNGVDFFLVHGFAAATLSLTSPNVKSNSAELEKIKQLRSHASTARCRLSNQVFTESIPGGVKAMLDARFIMAYIFLEITFLSFDMYDEGFLILREAVSYMELFRITEGGCNSMLSESEMARCIRLHWVFFMHERYLAVATNYPPILPALPLEWDLFPVDDGAPGNIHDGFSAIVQIFSVLDNDFISYWRSADRSCVMVDWIEGKRLQLDVVDYNELVSKTTGLNVTQLADLVITHHWILTLLWQMAISNCLLPSRSNSFSMSLEYPIQLSQQLRQVVTQLGRQSIERHGSGIIYKLFEITSTIADVIIHVPAVTDLEDLRRKDDFNVLLKFLHDFASLTEIQSKILTEKALAVENARSST